MSTTVDQRVVQMQFDNAQFEKGVQETLNSLNKLENSVSKTGKTHTGLLGGLAIELGLVGLKVKDIGNNVSQLNDRFSLLGTIGGRFVENITDSLYRMGVNAAKTLTGVNGMTDGFEKFGEKTRAVSTLMTATGASIEEVNECLDDLQWFTDETSYNFTSMIDTMSKLSATGEKDLRKLLKYTEGFALAAAKAGVGAAETSRGMFQLTQAASRGYLMYQDWQQSMGTTNIATAELKQKMIEASGGMAQAAGAYEDFNGSLKKGWLTFDIFGKVMEEYTQGITEANYENGQFIDSCNGAANSTTKFSEEAFRCAQECRTWQDTVDAVKDAIATGWSRSFEAVLGDANEVRGLFTGIANIAISIADNFAEARNEMLKTWKELGGRDVLIQSLVNVLNALWTYVHPLKEAFEEVFGVISGENLYGATNALEGLTRSLILSSDTMQDIKEIAVDIFSVIKAIWTAVAPYAKYIVGLNLIKGSLLSIGGILGGGLGLGSIFSLLKMILGLKVGAQLLGINVNITAILKAVANLGLRIKNVGKMIASYVPLDGIKRGLRTIVAVIAQLTVTSVNGIVSIVKTLRQNDIVSFIKNQANNAFTFIAGFLNKVGKTVKGFTGLELNFNFDNLLSGAGIVEDIFLRIFTGASKLIGLSVKLINAFNPFQAMTGTLKEINTDFEVTRDRIKGINGAASGTYTILDAFKDFLMYLNYFVLLAAQGIGTVLQGVLNLLNSIVEYAKTIDWSKLLAVAAIFFYIKYVYLLTGAVNGLASKINEMFGAIIKLKPAMIGTLSSIKKYFTQLTRANYYKSFRDIALGIALITGSLYALSYIPDDKLTKMAGILLGLTVTLGVVVGALAAVSKHINPVQLGVLTATVVVFAGAITSLTAAFGILTAIIAVVVKSCGDMEKAFDLLLAPFAMILGLAMSVNLVIIGLAGTFALVGGVAPLVKKGAVAIAEMAAAVTLLAGSLLAFHVAITVLMPLLAGVVAGFIGLAKAVEAFYKSAVENFGDTKVAISALVGLLVICASAIAAFVYVAQLFAASFSKSMFVTSKSILTFAASIAILSGAVVVLSVAAQNGGVAIGMLAGVMLAMCATMMIIKGFKLGEVAKEFQQLGVAIGAMGVGVFGMAKAMKIIGSMNVDQLALGFGGLAASIVVLAYAVNVMKDANIGKVALGILSLVAALYLLTPLMALWGTLAPTFLAGSAVVVGAIAGLAVAIHHLNDVKVTNVVPIVASMIGVMLSLQVLMTTINDLINGGNMNGILLSLLVSIGTLGACIALLSQITTTMDMSGVIAFGTVVGGLSVAVLALSASMLILAQIPYQQLGGIAAALNISMAVFTACIYALCAATNQLWSVKLGAMIAIMVAFAGSLSVLAVAIGLFAADHIGAVAIAIGVFTVALIALVAVCGTIGLAATPVLWALTGVMLGMAAVFLTAGVAIGVVNSTFATLVSVVVAGLPVAQACIEGVCNAIGNLVSTIVDSFVTAIVRLGSSLEHFITSMSKLDGKNLLVVAGAIATMGVALIPLGVGFTTAGAGGLVMAAGMAAIGYAIGTLGIGLSGLGTGFTIAASGVAYFKAALGILDTSTQAMMDKSKTWGSDLTNNIAMGMAKGSTNVGKTALGLAGVIAAPLHQSVADYGPLSTTDKWGGDLVQNIINGIVGKFKEMAAAALGLGDVVKKGFEEGTNGIGEDTLNNLMSQFSNGNFLSGMFSSGGSWGTSWGNGFTSSASSIVSSWAKMMSTQLQNITNQLKDSSLSADERSNLTWKANSIKSKQNKAESLKTGKDKSGRMIGVGEMEDTVNTAAKEVDQANNLPFDSSMFDTIIHDTQKASDAFGNLGNAAGSGGTGGGKGGGSGKSAADGMKDAEERAKKLAERMKTMKEYTDKSTKAVVQYNSGFGILLGTLSNVGPIQASRDAIEALAEKIYQATLTGDEAAMTAEERSAAVAKAFNEAFNSIKSSVESSINLFEEFDFALEKSMSPKTLLKNAESQLLGFKQMGDMYQDLALKGFSDDIIAKMIEGGTSEISHMKTMLKMTQEEVQQFNAAWASKEGIATFVASQGLASRALGENIRKLRENAKQYRASQEEVKKMFSLYDEIVASGNLERIADAEYTINQKAQELGMSVDQLRTFSQQTGATADEVLIRMVDNWEKAKATVLTYNEVLKETKDAIQEVLESEYSLFDEFSESKFTTGSGDDERDVTMDDEIEWQEKRLDATKEYGELTDKLSGKLEKYGDTGKMVFENLSKAGTSGLAKIRLFAEAAEEELDRYMQLVEENGMAMAEAASSAASTMAELAVGGQQIYLQAKQQVESGFVSALTTAADPNGPIHQEAEKIGITIEEAIARRISRETGYTTTEVYNSGLIQAMQDKLPELHSAADATATDADQTIALKINQQSGWDKTSNFMIGMINGVRDYKEELLRELEEVAEAMAELCEDEWDEHSPSKLTYKQAKFFMLGMANGIHDFAETPVKEASSAVDSITDVMKDALSTANDILNSEVDVNPTITPILDLSNVQNGSRQLSGMLNNLNVQGYHIDSNIGHVMTPAEKMQNIKSAIAPVTDGTSGGNNFNFVQNNYSPKALSRLDIYRQTKNQFSQLKGLVT